MPFPPSLMQMLKDYQLPAYPSFTGLPQPITISAITHCAGALVWAWLLLVSFTGWGRLTGKILRTEPLPTSVGCALGIATAIFVGGVLNLLHAIYIAALLVFVALGVFFYCLLRKERPTAYRWSGFWNKASTWSRLLVTITLLILFFRVVATVRLADFRIEDDAAAYLVFPQKMIAAHHFAADPFSDRRVISSVGGAYALQTLVIAATSLPHIGMTDRTLGLVLMFLALLDIGVAFGLSPPQIAAMELISYLAPQQTFNLTFEILPIALFLAMIWAIFSTVEQTANNRWRYTALAGIIGGAIVSLKSTFLPYVGAVALVPYIFLFWHKSRKQAWTLPIVAGLSALVVMAAWMIAMKYYSGTYLFPVLGHGVDYTSYHVWPSRERFSSPRGLVRVLLQGCVLLLLAAVQYISGIRNDKSRLSFGILIAAALAITAFNYESGGDYIWRYNFPQFFTAIVICFAGQAAVYNFVPANRRLKLAFGVATLSLISCIFYYDIGGGNIEPFRQMKIEMELYRCNLRASLSDVALVSPAVLAEYTAVRNSLPSGAVALDNTTNSFLLINDLKKTIFLDDWPGAASPSPGWTFTQGPEGVVQFLSKNSVRYLIYGYEYAHWFDMRSCQSIPNAAHFSELDHALQRLSFVTHHQFDQLRTTHKVIYDDGKIAVIDLGSPLSYNHFVEPDWTLHTSEADICSQISQSYIATHASSTQQKQSSWK